MKYYRSSNQRSSIKKGVKKGIKISETARGVL